VADGWWSGWDGALAPYGILLRLFVDGQMAAEEFEVVFLALYKNDPADWPGEIFDVLDRLFGDVDDFVADDRLRAETAGIDADELRRRASAAFDQLSKMAG
jgi:Bacterial self-protective colicin-like immunity